MASARRAVGDPDPLVRSAAIRALASHEDSRPVVEQALDDTSRLVRLDAAWALSPSLPDGGSARQELDTYLAGALDQPAGRFRVAQDLFNRGRTEEAIAYVRTAIAWDALSPALPENLGLMLSAQGRAAEAAREFERTLKLDTTSARPALYAALAWSEAGDLPRAENMLGVALRRDPNLARGWYNLGLLQAQTGRAQEAVVSLMEAERLATGEADFPYALATVLAQLGREEEAVAAARRALAADPNHAAAAGLLRQLGRAP
jgi:tetratricopeptide (TPR) repeat protein